MNQIKKFANNISIKYKVFLSYFVLIGFFVLLLVVTSTYLVSRNTRRNILYSSQQSMSQTVSYFNYITGSTRGYANALVSNATIQDILVTPTIDYDSDAGLWLIHRNEIINSFYSSEINPDLSDVKIGMWNGPASFISSNTLLNLNDYVSSDWMKNYDFTSKTLTWYNGADCPFTESDNIAVLKNIMDNNNLLENIGVLTLQIPASDFTTILNQSKITDSTYSLLISDENTICASDSYCESAETLSYSALDSYTTEHYSGNDSYWSGNENINGQKVMIGISPIEQTNWKLIMVIPESDVTVASQAIFIQAVIIYLVLIPFMLAASYLLSLSYTKRISSLAQQMKNIDMSIFDQNITPSSRDEIGVLTQSFNYMLTKMSMLLDEKYKLGQELKTSELKALQAQINPHFLYNTLDQIYWLGEKNQIPEISNLTLELSKFYRLSLNKGKSIVSLKDELNHIKSYTYIQNFRFDDAITLEISVPNPYLDYQVPKIILQPIVENAILHGICEKDAPGTIVITGAVSKNEFIVEIKDDGIGIPQDILQNLVTSLSNTEAASTSQGYGLSNIHRRIQLLYGEKYGVEITSVYEHGTTVTLHFPKSTA